MNEHKICFDSYFYNSNKQLIFIFIYHSHSNRLVKCEHHLLALGKHTIINCLFQVKGLEAHAS